MLDAVYVDTVDKKAMVAIRPKPAFRPLFEIATTRAGNGVVLINQTPQTQSEPEASESCSWWRRGRVGLSLELNHASASKERLFFPFGVRSY